MTLEELEVKVLALETTVAALDQRVQRLRRLVAQLTTIEQSRAIHEGHVDLAVELETRSQQERDPSERPT